MWQPMFPAAEPEDVPITHVTNGAHLSTFVGDPMRELLDRQLGDGLARARRRPRRLGGGARHPERGALGRALRGAGELVELRPRERSQADRLLRGEQTRLRARIETGSTWTRSRSASRGASPPTSASTCSRTIPSARGASARGDPPRPAPRRRQGAPERRGRQGHRSQALFGFKRAGADGRRPGVIIEDYDLARRARTSSPGATSGSTCRGRRWRRAARAA